MRRCLECGVDIEGPWDACPLCGASISGAATPSPLPVVALRFSRRRLLRVLFAVSLAVIAVSFAAQFLLGPQASGIGLFRSAWLGISAMWLVVLMAVRKRRNVAKSTVYLVVLVGLVCVYWDYLTGWRAWSLTYAVPIVCAAAIVALQIAVWALRTEVGEHVVYTALAVLLGLLPVAFLVFGAVTSPLPSAACGVLAFFALVRLQVTRGPDVRHELAKRLHL
ncbi:MAG: DUF6320 domain-containing protein [Arachnia sp.]